MLRIIITLLLFTVGYFCRGQISETRSSLLNQLIADVKLEARNYKQVNIDGSIPWDTSEFVFKKYLTSFDTTDQTEVAVKHGPTRRRIISFSKMVTSDDYRAFHEQIISQRSNSLNISTEIKESNESKNKMTVSFSQPLVTVDGKIAVIKIVRKYRSGEYEKLTTVYLRKESNWMIWDHLERESLFY